MKSMLLGLVLMFATMGISYSATIYANNGYPQKETPFKISSATCQGFNIGATPSTFTYTDEHKDLLITNEDTNTREVFLLYSMNATTWTARSGIERGRRIPVGTTYRLEKWYGTFWLINGDKSSTASSVLIDAFKNVK